MGDYSELLGRLDTLQKASAGDPPDNAEPKPEPKTEGGDDKTPAAATSADAGKTDETFGKAFKVKLEDGTETEAFDGTAMLKALHAENEQLRQTITDRDGELAKAFDIVVGVIDTQRTKLAEQTTQIGAQDALIKALQAKVETIGAAGVGRRTMLAIAEKLTPGVSPETGGAKAEANPQQVLMKAQFMAREGKLDWASAARIEAHQGRGSLAPADLLQRFPELLTPVS